MTIEVHVREALRIRAASLQPELVELRRALHRIPEPGFEVPLTQQAVLEALAGLPLQITTGASLGSVTAVLTGARPGPSVLLRGDMDALPIAEETGLPYAATNGAMHACGHDLHVAGLVGAAKLLCEMQADLAGSVVFMFQPGEEAGGGAPRMITEGVLEAAGSRVEAAYGIHVLPGVRGTFQTKPGPLMGGANLFTVTVHGKGGHGSRPHEAIDPVPVLAEMILALQSYATRRLSPNDPAIISVTKLSGSSAVNIIADEASFSATVRTLSRDVLEQLRVGLPRMVALIAEAHGCTVDANFTVVYPVTVNDHAATSGAIDALTETFGAERVETLTAPIMASEDFSFVLDEVPGTFLFLGATPPEIDPADAEMNHSPRAQFDDAVLGDQAVALAVLALQHLS
ncbi:hippurate hydrolase [Leucobacter exalbidus]|uniref:Hippurate hydrolase n=1 Tax=Leucobacter exalbidus TaxID=662960 RepID=A0A940PN04_9MICO|nr:M20 family metallopeptidase [Leucobacter exalbidus]MBP1326947.1 hippurate hydrolase [Leucobacter exalbidus]